jgi:heat shock protein HslJ
MRWIVILGIACALAAGCVSSNGDGASGGTLAGTKWRLTAWSASSSDPSQFTITADFSGSQISGTSAVNSYGGSYTATADGRFSVGDLQSTLMGGSEEAMRAETLYFDFLRQARKYAATQTTLTLKDGSNQDILIFNAR